MPTPKYRHLFTDLKARSLDTENEESDSVTIEGKAVTFEDTTVLYRIGDMEVTERIDAHALDNTDMSDVVFDLNHDWDRSIPLARTRNKSLVLEKRDDGLWFTAKIKRSNEEGMKVYNAIVDGRLDKCSFAFTIAKDGEEITERKGGYDIVVKDIDRLYDVSAVSIPAYDNTSLSARFAQDVDTFVAKLESDKTEQKRALLLKELNSIKF